MTLFPQDSDAMSVAYTVSVVLSTVLMVLAVRRVPASLRGPWNWILASLALCAAGEVLVLGLELSGNDRWPSPADGLFISSYLALALGTLGLHRQDNKRRASAAVLDAGIIALGVGVLSLVFFVLPLAADRDQTLITRMVGTVYPLLDVLLLFLVLRTLLGARRLGPTMWWVVASMSATMTADVGQNAVELADGSREDAMWMVVVWACSYLFLGFAAASASRTCPALLLEARAPADVQEGADLSLPRLAILAVAAGLPSGLLMVRAIDDRNDDWGLLGLGSIILLALVVGRVRDLLQQLRRQSARMAKMARTDPLTGIPNRRSWDFELTRALGEAHTSGSHLMVALLDLDHFKEFNDSRGHQAGDDLLKEAALAWSLGVGADGRISRWGGEEFAVVVSCPDVDAGLAVLDRLRGLVPFGQTVSIGVAHWDRKEDAVALLHRADRALYEAKKTGRDRLVLDGNGGIASTPRPAIGPGGSH